MQIKLFISVLLPQNVGSNHVLAIVSMHDFIVFLTYWSVLTYARTLALPTFWIYGVTENILECDRQACPFNMYINMFVFLSLLSQNVG